MGTPFKMKGPSLYSSPMKQGEKENKTKYSLKPVITSKDQLPPLSQLKPVITSKDQLPPNLSKSAPPVVKPR
jgi:hypothetical protein